MLCPRCDYDLTGLPPRHICPECGCQYDEHSILIRLKGRRLYFRNAVPLCLFLALGLGAKSRQGGISREAVISVTGLLILVLVDTFWRFQMRGHYPVAMLLDRAGVELITPGQEPMRWPWPDILRADVSWMLGRFRLIGRKKKSLISRRYQNLGGLKLTRQCAAEINKRIELYESSIPNPSIPTELTT